MADPDSDGLWRRIRRHPVAAGSAALFAVASALLLFLNELPDFFDKTLPWLGGHITVGQVSVTFQQLFAAVVMGGGLLLLARVVWITRPSTQRKAADVLLTWVYRRRFIDTISDGALYTEGAPESYGQDVYDLLGLPGNYRRAKSSTAEPGFSRRSSEAGGAARPPAKTGSDDDAWERQLRRGVAGSMISFAPPPERKALDDPGPDDAEEADVPEGWTGRFWRGKEVLRCVWADGFQTIFLPKWNAHQETHTDAPTPQDARQAFTEPRPWARTPIHFVGDAKKNWIGDAPADGSRTFYVAQPFALELVQTGLYVVGPLATQRHVLLEDGPPLRCRCGRTEPNTAGFQTHLSMNENADVTRRPPLARDLTYEEWAEQRPAWCEARSSVLAGGEELIARLQKVPVQPPPKEENNWYEPVRHWIHDEFHGRVVDPYWGKEQQAQITNDAMAGGAVHENKALPPEWRRKNVAAISARCAWLQDQPNDC